MLKMMIVILDLIIRCIPFLQWALTPPGYYMDWQSWRFVINLMENYMHFISGVPVQVKVHTQVITVCEINFLCCHKSLRDKRLAPTLIKEITIVTQFL